MNISGLVFLLNHCGFLSIFYVNSKKGKRKVIELMMVSFPKAKLEGKLAVALKYENDNYCYE